MEKRIDLEGSVQINNGFTETSGDGVNMCFDSKYGIMFCAYMPGAQGHYGESRGRISLSYFPPSQPTNIKFVEIAKGNDEYVPNIISLGDGKVRVLYEKNSKADGDHVVCYKDYDYLLDTLSEENIVMLNKEGTKVLLTGSEQFEYLEKHGFFNHTYCATEQITIGGGTIFQHEDGCHYGAISSFLSEVILYRSRDNMASVEFFAIYPKPAQYEFDYKFLNGTIHAVYRTNREIDAISYTSSQDYGKTWTEPVDFKESIQCRPRIIIHNNDILMSYNYYNNDTKYRPEIQQGRTSVRICYKDIDAIVCDLYSHYGIVNVCLCDILNDVYMAYSTSVLALEYQNKNSMVRGKDAIRYIKLGNLSENI